MELVITEKPDDNSVKFRCDLCDYNPYQAWCKGNTARFHSALMKHKQTIRHKEAEAFANGEQPITISKGGAVSADAPPSERPPHFYITKLEKMIDTLEQRIDALNSAYDPSDTTSEYNLNNLGSLVDVFPISGGFQKSEKSGDLVMDVGPPVLNVAIHTFQFKEAEMVAMERFGDGSCITNTNTLNAVQRCLTWCEVYIKDEERRDRNVAFLTRTKEAIKSVCQMVADGWRPERGDYDAVGERLDGIMGHDWRSN